MEDEKSATLFLHIEGMRGEQMASEFTEYMRKILQRKGVSQQQMFRSADISEKYGYKLVSGEKHTRQRDLLIKLGIAAHFTEKELSEALILYGMAPLYQQNARDAKDISVSMIQNLVKQFNPDIPDLEVEVEFIN